MIYVEYPVHVVLYPPQDLKFIEELNSAHKRFFDKSIFTFHYIAMFKKNPVLPKNCLLYCSS